MIISGNELNAMSALALAHMGDAVYELLARRELCRSGKLTAGDLHRQTVRIVSAAAQAVSSMIQPECTWITSYGRFLRNRTIRANMAGFLIPCRKESVYTFPPVRSARFT